MKRNILLFICITSSVALLGQVNAQKCDYAALYNQGAKAAKDSLFDKALLCFNSARRCDPSKGKEIDEAINAVFRGIQKQKQTAIDERNRAEAQTKIATAEKKRAEEQTQIAIEQKDKANKSARQSKALPQARMPHAFYLGYKGKVFWEA